MYLYHICIITRYEFEFLLWREMFDGPSVNLDHPRCEGANLFFYFHNRILLVRWCKYDGASVKAEKKLEFFFSTVLPKTADFFFSTVFPFFKTAEKNLIFFSPPFFQKQQNFFLNFFSAFTLAPSYGSEKKLNLFSLPNNGSEHNKSSFLISSPPPKKKNCGGFY